MLKRLALLRLRGDGVRDVSRDVPLRDRLRRRLPVPKTLDGPLETSLPAALAVNAALLTVFAVQHSVMARPLVQGAGWTANRPLDDRALAPTSCSPSLALLLLFWQWRPIGVEVWTIAQPGGAPHLDALRRGLADSS